MEEEKLYIFIRLLLNDGVVVARSCGKPGDSQIKILGNDSPADWTLCTYSTTVVNKHPNSFTSVERQMLGM